MWRRLIDNLQTKLFGPSAATAAAGGSPYATPGKWRRGGLHGQRWTKADCSDFLAAVPVAPSFQNIEDVVYRRCYTTPPGSAEEEAIRRHTVRCAAFDIKYRCGAAGRCVAADVVPRQPPPTPPNKNASTTTAAEEEQEKKNGAAAAASSTTTTTVAKTTTTDDLPPLSTAFSVPSARNVPACRFPCCFQLRPMIKGAEVLQERSTFEIIPDDLTASPSLPQIAELIRLAQRDELQLCQSRIRKHVDQRLKDAVHEYSYKKKKHEKGGGSISGSGNGLLSIELLGSRSEASDFQQMAEVTSAMPAVGEGSVYHGVNPLRHDDELRAEVVALYRWRAALLVNLRRDEEAVHSLLNLARAMRVPPGTSPSVVAPDAVEDLARLRMQCYQAAATWAVLHDMEIIYYRSLSQSFDVGGIAVAASFAKERSTLLRRVVDAAIEEDKVSHGGSGGSAALQAGLAGPYLQSVVHMCFAKEMTAMITRVQLAQQQQSGGAVLGEGDETEDPMKTPLVGMTLRYYRYFVHDAFWRSFFDLLLLPPQSAPPPPSSDATTQNVAENELTQQQENRNTTMTEGLTTAPGGAEGQPQIKKDDAAAARHQTNKKAETEGDEGAAVRPTPPFIWDAIGRSLYLHHLLQSHEAQEAHRATIAKGDRATAEATSALARGAVAPREAAKQVVDAGQDEFAAKHAVDAAAKMQQLLTDSDSDPFLLQRHVMLVAARMKELLGLIRGMEEERQQHRTMVGGSGRGRQLGRPS